MDESAGDSGTAHALDAASAAAFESWRSRPLPKSEFHGSVYRGEEANLKKVGELSEEAKLHLPGDPTQARIVSHLDLHKVGELIGWSQLSRSGEMSSIYNLYGVKNSILEAIYSNTGYTLGVERDPSGDFFSSADKGAGALNEAIYYLLLGVDSDDLKVRSLPMTRVAELYSEWSSKFHRDERTKLTFTRWAASS